MSDMTLHEAIHTQRAMRRFKPDPIDDALIEQILEAATRAPSGGNRQPWRFIVVKDQKTKAQLGELYDQLSGTQSSDIERTAWAEVPVLIVVCSYSEPGSFVQSPIASAASVLPAVQNLLLTARSLGIGTVLTTRWHARESEFRAILGLPETAAIHVVIPAGWPVGRFGSTTRMSVEEVTFRDHWGTPWKGR